MPCILVKANINLSNLSATGRAVINGKANVDLDNLSEEGQAIIDGKASISLDNLSGPVGIYSVVGETAKAGFINVIYI